MRNTDPYIFLIPFRSGSKGLENKNIISFSNRPLYEWTFDQALYFKDIKVYVSTDYSLNNLGGPRDDIEYIKRRNSLSQDNIEMSEVVKDFIEANLVRNTKIILLQVTSPLRTKEDIQEAMKLFDGSDLDLVMSVTEIDKSFLKSGLISKESKFKPIHSSKSSFSNRQDLPQPYIPNGMVYIFYSDWFIKNNGFETEHLGVVKIPKNRSIDIDSKEDLILAENEFSLMHNETK